MYINEDVPNIILLRYADDIAMCVDMPGRLYHILNVLKLNLLKTKMLVLRCEGIGKRSEKQFYSGTIIACVKVYKYLGLVFTTILGVHWQKKVICTSKQLYMYNNKCNGLPHFIYLNIFDKNIASDTAI